jgi:hypothetical protein
MQLDARQFGKSMHGSLWEFSRISQSQHVVACACRSQHLLCWHVLGQLTTCPAVSKLAVPVPAYMQEHTYRWVNP